MTGCSALLLLILNALSLVSPSFYKAIESDRKENVEIIHLLDQEFTYIGEGSQMMAFASQDGLYVLKLFKAKHTPPFKLSRCLQKFIRTEEQRARSTTRWENKFSQTCKRYEVAFAHLREETALVHLHLFQTKEPLPVTLIRRKAATLDLSELSFVIQKKALLAPAYFQSHPSLAKEALKTFFKTRLQKGFSDPRQTLSKNYGFIDDLPVQIDPGKIEPFTGDFDAELNKIYTHIEEWALRF